MECLQIVTESPAKKTLVKYPNQIKVAVMLIFVVAGTSKLLELGEEEK